MPDSNSTLHAPSSVPLLPLPFLTFINNDNHDNDDLPCRGVKMFDRDGFDVNDDTDMYV